RVLFCSGVGLAPAAFADQPQRLATVDREVDAIDGLHVADLAAEHDPLGNGEVHGELAHLQQRCRDRRVVHAATSWLTSSSVLRKQAARWPLSTGSSAGCS